MKRHALFTIVAALLMALPLCVFAADSPPPLHGARLLSPPRAPDPAKVTAGPVSGDMVVMGMLGEPTTMLDFMSSDTASREVAANFYVGLLKYDKNMEVIQWAAESFEVLDDGLRLRFVLRNDIYWSDGIQLTVDDVEFTYNLMRDPETPTAYGSDFRVIKAFTRTGDSSFEVTYAQPFPRALNTWMQSIMPKHLLQGADLRNTPLHRNPVSAGPYCMEEWQAGSHIRLKANPRYFQGKPHIEAIYYRFIPDSTTMFLELKSGSIDILGGLTPLQFLRQTDTPEFRNNFDLWQWMASLYTYMGYNLKSPLFSDARVRRAIAHALDKNEIVKGVLMGQGMATVGPFRPGSWVYNTKIKDYEHNQEKALALLKEAGWVRGKNGILHKDGLPFSFTLLVNQGNETRVNTAQIIQYQLKKIGMDIKIRTVEWAAFLKQFVDTGFFDALILGWTIPHEPDPYDVWHSSRIGQLNFISFSNKEVDTLLENARTTFDQAARKVMYDRFQEILHEEQPYCFLFVPYTQAAVHKRFMGLDPAPAGIFHNANFWWVPQSDQRYRLGTQ